ncbi:MAG: glycosyltransferase [Bacteroidota bacterium]
MVEQKPAVLIAALHWGLGHATRCVPIIKAFQKQACRVFIASDGAAGILLRQQFPELPYLELPAYNIHYAGENLTWSLLKQSPRVWRAIQQEQKVLTEWMVKYQFQLIVSDNRYGCHHPDAFNVFLGHQLAIQATTPLSTWVANQVQGRLLKPFSEAWVPDFRGEKNLSGALGHPTRSPISNTHYLGGLSRFAKASVKEEKGIVALVSGPEPERSQFAKSLLEQLEKLPLPSTLILGTPQQSTTLESKTVRIIPFLDGTDLQETLASAQYIICRSGYSSLMDLQRLGKKALLIPTPGQPEQEYLAQRMEALGWLPFQEQRKLQLETGLKLIDQYQGIPIMEAYQLDAMAQAALRRLKNQTRV